jgi:hypothetical protein
MDPDPYPGGSKTYGSDGSGFKSRSATLVVTSVTDLGSYETLKAKFFSVIISIMPTLPVFALRAFRVPYSELLLIGHRIGLVRWARWDRLLFGMLVGMLVSFILTPIYQERGDAMLKYFPQYLGIFIE